MLEDDLDIMELDRDEEIPETEPEDVSSADDSEISLEDYEKGITTVGAKFDYLLTYSEPDRHWVNITYKRHRYDVIPLGKFKKTGKYILRVKDGSTLVGTQDEFKLNR